MLRIDKKDAGSKTLIEMVGVIDETASLAAIQPATPSSKEIEVSGKGVQRINSIGTKAWRQHFDGLRKIGVKLRFVELAPALVQQVNFIPDFIPIPEIESVRAVFFCESCKLETVQTFKVSELKAADLENLSVKCGKCGQPAEFDELPDEYFGFISGA